VNYQKIAVFLSACLFFNFLTPLQAVDTQGSYGSFADYLNNIYGIDNNAGLTTFPILNIPMGGRSEGMASAFTAVSDDVSFIEYNPAGSSMLTKSEIAFFHNNWIADSKMEGLPMPPVLGIWELRREQNGCTRPLPNIIFTLKGFPTVIIRKARLFLTPPIIFCPGIILAGCL